MTSILEDKAVAWDVQTFNGSISIIFYSYMNVKTVIGRVYESKQIFTAAIYLLRVSRVNIRPISSVNMLHAVIFFSTLEWRRRIKKTLIQIGELKALKPNAKC